MLSFCCSVIAAHYSSLYSIYFILLVSLTVDFIIIEYFIIHSHFTDEVYLLLTIRNTIIILLKLEFNLCTILLATYYYFCSNINSFCIILDDVGYFNQVVIHSSLEPFSISPRATALTSLSGLTFIFTGLEC